METATLQALPNLSSWEGDIFYPDSDGQPMANSSEHFERITTTKHGIESVFANRDDVFVAGDLFWYPVKGKTKIAVAPDVMVALGRPKGARKSYRQWNEENTPPQVVFEFLSDSNTQSEMMRKAAFFERYGVQEYYVYDLEHKQLSGLIRFTENDEALEEIPDMNDWKSPRLGIMFDMSSGELVLRKPDGEPFLSYAEINAELDDTRAELDATKTYTATLAAKLRELGMNPDAL
ncbi:MAG: Uma2 family endonuclease [Candidatus Kapaibacterium sp.]|nr:MAG: Uma2 family endonuclease [Candidatus Kapabacteria bacterium]